MLTLQELLNDEFKIGIQIDVKKKTIKLYTHFGISDLIIASPIGLKMLKSDKKEREDKEAKVASQVNYGFLSSIEVLYLDKAHVFNMQNMEHLIDVLKSVSELNGMALILQLNKVPDHKSTTESFQQIRPLYFENLAKFFRQTLVLKEYDYPRMNSLTDQFFLNYTGRIQEKAIYKRSIFWDILQRSHEGVHSGSSNLFKMKFELKRIDLTDFQKEFDQKFNYFSNQVWRKLRDEDTQHRMIIFVKDYFEFVRLKGFLK